MRLGGALERRAVVQPLISHNARAAHRAYSQRLLRLFAFLAVKCRYATATRNTVCDSGSVTASVLAEAAWLDASRSWMNVSAAAPFVTRPEGSRRNAESARGVCSSGAARRRCSVAPN